jgi:hypothetical protein
MPIINDTFKYLGFFDKNGTDLNFTFDNVTGIWTGSVNLPEISVDLYETATVVILQEFLTNTGITKWGIPHYSDPGATFQTTGSYDGSTWRAYWEDETDQNDKFILFTFDLSQSKPKLNTVDTAIVDVDIDPNQTYTTYGQTVTDVVTSQGIQFNIGLCSDVEGIYERYLIIEEDGTNNMIARIKFYGEVVGEDERLTVLIQNLGYSLFAEDSPVFRSSDINESLPDYILLNEKRKEMLLEGKNIQPFIGSYKGVINAIKFFGYDNVKLREYWLNIDDTSPNYGKYKTTTVIDIFDPTVNLNDPSTQVPNKIYKKTALFALAYRINNVTNQLDEYDFPVVTEASDFTIEEALIKLYGLKEILRKRFLPSSSRIIDIVGEADYFGKTVTSVWNDQQRIDNLNIGITPSIEVTPRFGYIQDLRPLNSLFDPEYTPYLLDRFVTLQNLDTRVLGDIGPVLLAYFQTYGPNLNTIAQLPDKPGIPVGCPVVLENKSFEIDWIKAEVQWDELWANGVLVMDFLASNIASGDTFIIKDLPSGKEISYTASFGDTAANVAAGLLASFNAEYVIGDGKPWTYFEATLVDKDNDSTLETFRLRQVISGNFNLDLQAITQDNGAFGNNPKLTKSYAAGNTLLTWDTFGHGNFYEIEWRVFKKATDTPAYEFSVRGDIATYNTLALNLPYEGIYNVEVRLYDTFNNMSSRIYKDHVEVLSKEVEYIGFYKFKEPEYTWTNLFGMKKLLPPPPIDLSQPPIPIYPQYIWNEYGSSWDLPIAPDNSYFDGEASLYEALDRANYILNNSNPDQSLCYHYTNPEVDVYKDLYTPGPYFWDNTGSGTWDDSYHIWWSSCKISGDTPANFRIYNVTAGKSMAMQQRYPYPYTSTFVFTTNDLAQAADDLNSTTDPVFSKFIYNKVYDVDTSGNLILQFVQAVARYTGQNGNWTNFTWQDPFVDVRYEDLTEINNPTYNDTRFLVNGIALPKLVHVTFTYDMTKIPGKDFPIWTLKNIDSPDTDDIYFTGRWFTYLFKRSGRYELSLELQDSNGNKKKTTKNVLIIK